MIQMSVGFLEDLIVTLYQSLYFIQEIWTI